MNLSRRKSRGSMYVCDAADAHVLPWHAMACHPIPRLAIRSTNAITIEKPEEKEKGDKGRKFCPRKKRQGKGIPGHEKETSTPSHALSYSASAPRIRLCTTNSSQATLTSLPPSPSPLKTPVVTNPSTSSLSPLFLFLFFAKP
jgi:hypothetical protein